MGNTKIETISNEDLKKLVAESGLSNDQIEKGVGMPSTTLDKCLRAKPDGRGYTRTLPTKWVKPLMEFIQKKKVENLEVKEEVQQILSDHNIEVKEPEVFIPDSERKKNWIDKLQEVKSQLT